METIEETVVMVVDKAAVQDIKEAVKECSKVAKDTDKAQPEGALAQEGETGVVALTGRVAMELEEQENAEILKVIASWQPTEEPWPLQPFWRA